MPLQTVAYNCSFTVGATVAGFFTRTNGYSAPKEANRTVTAIPWAQTYSVVIQRGGINPMTRRYRALVKSEDDFTALALLVNKSGTLVTPRQSTPTLANLDSIDYSDAQDPTDANGMATIELSFTLLQ